VQRKFGASRLLQRRGGALLTVRICAQGVHWARESGTSECGPLYEPTVRPWFISGSNGPKNVIFILDSSMSMSQPLRAPRIDMLKKAALQLVDSLTMADFVSIIDFDDGARTYLDLNYMARARQGFRQEMKKFINAIEANGQTAYDKVSVCVCGWASLAIW
jgi:hypothetical protein